MQGVGFRPFVHRLAHAHGVAGFVLNDGEGVVIEAEGPSTALDAFAAAVVDAAPALARVSSLVAERIEPRGELEFAIRISEGAAVSAGAVIPPDTATCEDCLRELFDPADRRYRYPFLNCTQCGPRLTIVRSVPYDRARTTMASFELCADCRREYEDPGDRRFHAEPIACPVCGPQLSLPLAEAVACLRAGGILAVKGLGGYHLACDARDEDAVARLRGRKHREEKPLAVMTGDPDALCLVEPEERVLLESPARPIVLMRRLPDAPVAHSIAPGSPWLGVLLPYTPLHHLLWHDLAVPLRAHERQPQRRADRVRRRRSAPAPRRHRRRVPRQRPPDPPPLRGLRRPAGAVLRRSRGYAPSSLPLPVAAPVPIVAAGGELKSTFCVAREGEAFLSAHLGDLDSELAYRAFRTDLELYLEMLAVEPAAVACDLHPEYLSTKWAREQQLPLVEVQHHHAHAAACLAEHGEEGPALALVFDGTGYGTDGTLWGGELLRADLDSFERLAWLDPVPLPGGETAVREPWRMAAVHLERAGLDVPWPAWHAVRESLAVNAPLSSGMGRLFDAVAALLGVRDRVSYEGQAAIELELLAGDTAAEPWAWRFGQTTTLVVRAAADLAAGRPREEIAAAFHETVAASAAAVAYAHAGTCRTAVLSGGSFQNRRLAASTRTRLQDHGLRVLEHRLVPANDGGISYGQAAVAARRLTCA